MTLILDAETEHRIQREIELGHYSNPSEVIARAVSLLTAESEWLLRNKEALNEHLDESMAQLERGETISGDSIRGSIAALIAEHRIARAG